MSSNSFLKNHFKYIIVLSLIFIEVSVVSVDDIWAQPKRGLVIPEPTETLSPANATNATLMIPSQIDTGSVNANEASPKGLDSIEPKTPELIPNVTDMEPSIENKTFLDEQFSESLSSNRTVN